MHCLTGSASEKNKTHILAFKCCGKLFRTGPSAVSHIQYHHAQMEKMEDGRKNISHN